MRQEIIPKIQPVEKSNEFVGIKIEEGVPVIYVPQIFRKSSDVNTLKKDLLLFLKSIEISKSVEKTRLKAAPTDEHEEVWPIESYIWIIHDYIANGVYYNREKIYVNENKGKIDWKRTMRSAPVMSNGNMIYDKIVSSKMRATNDIVSQIYKICVFQSQIRFGWIYGYNISIDVEQIKSIKEMIFIILNEMKQTFDDEKKLRFSHMLHILKNIEGSNALSRNYTYGIENYYYVFENMVDSIFHGIEKKELKKYNPNGYWKIRNQEAIESSELRPDTIHIDGDKMYIIDAKMYQYGFTKLFEDLPTTSSMQKQITYGDYVKTVAGNDVHIRNSFVLPYNKELDFFKHDQNITKYLDGDLAYLGEAYVAWRNDRKEEYDTIYTFMIDLNYLLNNYAKEDKSCLFILTEKIEELVKNGSLGR